MVPVLTLLGGGLGALWTFQIQRRQAGAQELTAQATVMTAETVGRKAAVDELSARTQEWQALLNTSNTQVATAQNLVTAVGMQNETLKADLAALNLKLEQHAVTATARQADIDLKLAECTALNAALVKRMEHLEEGQAINRGRLGALERDHDMPTGHPGDTASDETGSRGGR